MIDHLSASQINLYLQCPLKYRFQYVDQIPKPFKPSGLVFGSVIHSALEWFHKERLKGNGVSLEKLFKIFETDWYCQKVETIIRFKESGTETKLLVMGKELLGIYFRSPLNKIKGAEVPFLVPLLNPDNGKELEVPIEGIIDLIEEDDVVVEFKTSSATMDPQSLSDHLQLTVYSYAYKHLFGKEARLLRIINLVKSRTPKMAILETSRGKKDYERLFNLTTEVLRGIKSGHFYPKGSWMCKECEYETNCQRWQSN